MPDGTATIQKYNPDVLVIGAGSGLTIASGLTLKGYGLIAALSGEGSPGTLINNGTILANVSGRTLTISPSKLINNGTMASRFGDLALTPFTPFNHTGTLEIGDGSISAGSRSITNAATGMILSSGSGRLGLGAGISTGTLINEGTISPGGSGTVGTLFINGNLTLTSSSLLEIDLGVPSLSSRVSLGGGGRTIV